MFVIKYAIIVGIIIAVEIPIALTIVRKTEPKFKKVKVRVDGKHEEC